jgi:hypothetical protein
VAWSLPTSSEKNYVWKIIDAQVLYFPAVRKDSQRVSPCTCGWRLDCNVMISWNHDCPARRRRLMPTVHLSHESKKSETKKTCLNRTSSTPRGRTSPLKQKEDSRRIIMQT